MGIRVFFAGVVCFVFCGCASPPKTEDEIRGFMTKNLTGLGHKSFAVHGGGSLDDIEKRLRAFARKCLSMETQTTRENCRVRDCINMHNQYYPTVKRTPEAVALFLKQVNSHMADGFYMFFLEVRKTNGALEASEVYPTMSHGNLSEDADGWLAGTGQMCPQLD